MLPKAGLEWSTLARTKSAHSATPQPRSPAAPLPRSPVQVELPRCLIEPFTFAGDVALNPSWTRGRNGIGGGGHRPVLRGIRTEVGYVDLAQGAWRPSGRHRRKGAMMVGVTKRRPT
jgi:hypothetical protein